jgi:predicted HicB family RNase H-like nuclease
MLKYKGYTATIEIDLDAEMLYGELLGIKDIVTFEGRTVAEIKQEFYRSVDAYLKFCSNLGQSPNLPDTSGFASDGAEG